MRIFLVGMVAALTAACAIPARDNHTDPSNSPDVRVRLLDYTDGDLGSECPAFAGSGAEISVASRGSCLAFDASATTDQGGALVTGSAFTWSLVDDDGEPIETFEGKSSWLVL